MIAWLAFALVAVALLWGAWRVVSGPDLVRSVLWLAFTLLVTAVAFVMLRADFLAAVQVLLYTGGIVTLMLFAVMLVRGTANPSGDRARAALVAAGVFGLVLVAVRRVPATAAPAWSFTAGDLGELVMTRLLLPFEALSVLLLAAMVGAILLARRTDA